MRKTIFNLVIRVNHPKSTDYFIMDTYFEGDGISRLERHFQNLKFGVTELLCHPGYVDEIVTAVSDWTYVREIKFNYVHHFIIN